MAIFLVRHAQSQGNVNEKVHQEMADHSIELSKEGLQQADRAGEFIQNYISSNSHPDDRTRLWASPYLRTTQTAQGVLKNAQKVNWDTNPQGGKIYYDTRLREREHGFFDGLSDELIADQYPQQWQHVVKTKSDSGGFYARMYGGESGADVSDRLATFKETLFRDINNGVQHHVIVNHGYTLRCFVNMFLHLHPKHFAAERNPKNTEVRLLDTIDGSKRYGDFGTIYTPDGVAILEKPKQHKIYTIS